MLIVLNKNCPSVTTLDAQLIPMHLVVKILVYLQVNAMQEQGAPGRVALLTLSI
tara:strand:- start:455 stop:616 length:162 start_codon:yes stop_codon:yes gene_type:complete